MEVGVCLENFPVFSKARPIAHRPSALRRPRYGHGHALHAHSHGGRHIPARKPCSKVGLLLCSEMLLLACCCDFFRRNIYVGSSSSIRRYLNSVGTSFTPTLTNYKSKAKAQTLRDPALLSSQPSNPRRLPPRHPIHKLLSTTP